MSPSETVFLSSSQWATSRLWMKQKLTHSLAWERTLTGDSRQKPAVRARSPVLLALSRIYLRQAYFSWKGAIIEDECKVNPQIKFKQSLLLFNSFLWQLDLHYQHESCIFLSKNVYYLSVWSTVSAKFMHRTFTNKKKEKQKSLPSLEIRYSGKISVDFVLTKFLQKRQTAVAAAVSSKVGSKLY